MQKTNMEINLANKQDRIRLLQEKLFAYKLEKITCITSIGKKIRKATEKVIPGSRGFSGNEWDTLANLFRQSFPALENVLWHPHSPLTKAEINIGLLSFFKFTIKQESIVMDIASDSISKQRYRLKKSLQLDNATELFAYLQAYCIRHE